MSEAFQQQVLSALGTLQASVNMFAADLGLLPADVGTLRAEVGALRSDVGVLQTDVNTLRGDVTSLQGQMGQVRAVLDRTEIKVDKLMHDMEAVLPRLSLIEANIAHTLASNAIAQNRIDNLDVRLSLVDRRLEIRDK